MMRMWHSRCLATLRAEGKVTASEVALADARAEITRLRTRICNERLVSEDYCRLLNEATAEIASLHEHIGALENSAAVAASAAWERMVEDDYRLSVARYKRLYCREK